MKRCYRFKILWLFSLILLMGCQTTRSNVEFELETKPPQEWVEKEAIKGAVLDGWLKDFNDNQLENIVEEAINKNFDLQTAAANLDIAQQNAIKAGALLKPIVNLGGKASRSENLTDNITENVTKGVSLDIS